MSKKKLNFQCKRTSDGKYAENIFKILKNTLLTPSEYINFSEEEKNNYKNIGFVIGTHNLITLEEWLKNKENIIIITTIDNKNIEKLVGYLICLQTTEIQEKVKDYLKDMVNLDKNLRKNLDEDFAYLIQVAVERDYANRGIGSAMFRELKKHLKRTVVSYVMKNPLLNEISLYAHLKSGFFYFGDYIGNYDEFKDYQSIGLMLQKSNISSKNTLKKDDILDMMKKASHIVPIK